MTEESGHKINYTGIWIGLMILMAVSVAVGAFHLPAAPAAAAVFSIAAWKATLVIRNYMHVRSEGALVASLVVVPILLLVILVILLLPDISFADNFIRSAEK